MEQNKTMPETTLIRSRVCLEYLEEIFNMGVLPEVGRKNTLKLITSCQKNILAFLLQKQIKKTKQTSNLVLNSYPSIPKPYTD